MHCNEIGLIICAQNTPGRMGLVCDCAKRKKIKSTLTSPNFRVSTPVLKRKMTISVTGKCEIDEQTRKPWSWECHKLRPHSSLRNLSIGGRNWSWSLAKNLTASIITQSPWAHRLPPIQKKIGLRDSRNPVRIIRSQVPQDTNKPGWSPNPTDDFCITNWHYSSSSSMIITIIIPSCKIQSWNSHTPPILTIIASEIWTYMNCNYTSFFLIIKLLLQLRQVSFWISYLIYIRCCSQMK